jgi:hypothetical protein
MGHRTLAELAPGTYDDWQNKDSRNQAKNAGDRQLQPELTNSYASGLERPIVFSLTNWKNNTFNTHYVGAWQKETGSPLVPPLPER